MMRIFLTLSIIFSACSISYGEETDPYSPKRTSVSKSKKHAHFDTSLGEEDTKTAPMETRGQKKERLFHELQETILRRIEAGESITNNLLTKLANLTPNATVADAIDCTFSPYQWEHITKQQRVKIRETIRMQEASRYIASAYFFMANPNPLMGPDTFFSHEITYTISSLQFNDETPSSQLTEPSLATLGSILHTPSEYNKHSLDRFDEIERRTTLQLIEIKKDADRRKMTARPKQRYVNHTPQHSLHNKSRRNSHGR